MSLHLVPLKSSMLSCTQNELLARKEIEQRERERIHMSDVRLCPHKGNFSLKRYYDLGISFKPYNFDNIFVYFCSIKIRPFRFKKYCLDKSLYNCSYKMITSIFQPSSLNISQRQNIFLTENLLLCGHSQSIDSLWSSCLCPRKMTFVFGRNKRDRKYALRFGQNLAPAFGCYVSLDWTELFNSRRRYRIGSVQDASFCI